jgi:hypothetical protein
MLGPGKTLEDHLRTVSHCRCRCQACSCAPLPSSRWQACAQGGARMLLGQGHHHSRGMALPARAALLSRPAAL